MGFFKSAELTYNSLNSCFSCLAGGYPVPTYEWFREEYEADKLISKKIDPMSDKRYTLSGGSLIINNPQEVCSDSLK